MLAAMVTRMTPLRRTGIRQIMDFGGAMAVAGPDLDKYPETAGNREMPGGRMPMREISTTAAVRWTVFSKGRVVSHCIHGNSADSKSLTLSRIKPVRAATPLRKHDLATKSRINYKDAHLSNDFL